MGGRNQAAYKKARAAMLKDAKAKNLPCAICHRPIRWDQDGNKPLGPTADHLLPVRFGGDDNEPDPLKLRPAHRQCQSRQGALISNKTRHQPRTRRVTTKPTTPPPPATTPPHTVTNEGFHVLTPPPAGALPV